MSRQVTCEQGGIMSWMSWWGNGMRVLSGDGVDMDDGATPTFDTNIQWVFKCQVPAHG